MAPNNKTTPIIEDEAVRNIVIAHNPAMVKTWTEHDYVTGTDTVYHALNGVLERRTLIERLDDPTTATGNTVSSLCLLLWGTEDPGFQKRLIGDFNLTSAVNKYFLEHGYILFWVNDNGVIEAQDRSEVRVEDVEAAADRMLDLCTRKQQAQEKQVGKEIRKAQQIDPRNSGKYRDIYRSRAEAIAARAQETVDALTEGEGDEGNEQVA